MRWGEHVTSEFGELKKMFWKSINRRRKPQVKLEVVVKSNGEILDENEQAVERLSEYFESLLNVQDNKKANLTSMGREGVTSNNVRAHTILKFNVLFILLQLMYVVNCMSSRWRSAILPEFRFISYCIVSLC
jgi:hypothetical protein